MFTFFDRISPAQILYENDGKGGGGGSSTVEAKLPDEVVEGFRSLINKEGGGKDAAATLFLENKSLRDDRRELKEKLEAYQAISEDPEELKKKFNAYKELGEDPEELEDKLEKGQEAIQKNAKYENEKQNNQVAEVYDWNAKVLNRLSDEDAEYEVKTRENDEGEDEKYAVIKTEDGEKDLQEYAKENWDDMMPALKANGESGSDEEEGSGKSFSKQKSTSDGKSNEDDPVAARIERNKEKRGVDSDDD